MRSLLLLSTTNIIAEKIVHLKALSHGATFLAINLQRNSILLYTVRDVN